MSFSDNYRRGWMLRQSEMCRLEMLHALQQTSSYQPKPAAAHQPKDKQYVIVLSDDENSDAEYEDSVVTIE